MTSQPNYEEDGPAAHAASSYVTDTVDQTRRAAEIHQGSRCT